MDGTLIRDAIQATGFTDVIKMEDGAGNSVRIVHRVAPGSTRRWVSVLQHVLQRKPPSANIHACRHYFLIDGKIRYAWNFVLQVPEDGGDKIKDSIGMLITQALSHLPKVGVRLDTYPLDAPANRNVPKGSHNPRASGPRTGGLSQKGVHILK